MTLPQLRPNFRLDIVSFIIDYLPETATTSAVLVLPVNDSFRSMVRAESRNGMYPVCFWLIIATIRPNAEREVLIFLASSALKSSELITPVFVILSLPARSAKMNFDDVILPLDFFLSFSVMTQCERLDRSFKLWDLAVRVASIVYMMLVISSASFIGTSVVPVISYSVFLLTFLDSSGEIHLPLPSR